MWPGWWAPSLQLRSGGGDTWEWCSWQPHQGHPGDVGEGGRDPTGSLFWALFSAVPPRRALQALTSAGGAALPLCEVLLGEHPRTSSLGAEQGKHSSSGKTLSSNSLNTDSLPAVHVSHLVFTSGVAVVFLQQGRVSRCGAGTAMLCPVPSRGLSLPHSTLMALSALQPLPSSSPCSWPASTAAATRGSTCCTRGTSSTT